MDRLYCFDMYVEHYIDGFAEAVAAVERYEKAAELEDVVKMDAMTAAAVIAWQGVASVDATGPAPEIALVPGCVGAEARVIWQEQKYIHASAAAGVGVVAADVLVVLVAVASAYTQRHS